MRVLLKAQIDAETGTRAIQDGTMRRVIAKISETATPEAAYFGPQDGKRTMMLFLDLEDSSLIPRVTEPLFAELNAELEILPVMNQEEMARGMAS